MQEAKLPQTFLKSVMNEIPASVDVSVQKFCHLFHNTFDKFFDF
jgi:hypothetical protein